jgi:hypothetical protein
VQAATKIDFDMLCFQFEKVMKHPDFNRARPSFRSRYRIPKVWSF